MLFFVHCARINPVYCCRFEVDNAHVKWDTPLDYKPPYFTALNLIPENRPVWADPELTADNFGNFKFNALDGKIDRRSHHGRYELLGGIFPRYETVECVDQY